MQLYKPTHKSYVVTDIEPVPESTDNKYVELVHGLAFDSTPLVDTLSQPLLDTHVPIIYFLTDVRGRLDYPWMDDVDPFEILTAIGYT